jgi:hypothetical protein
MKPSKSTGRPKGKNCTYRAGKEMCYRRAVAGGLCQAHAEVMAQPLPTVAEAVGEKPAPLDEETMDETVETQTPQQPAPAPKARAPKVKPIDTEAQASALALQILAREQAAKNAQRDGVRRDKDGFRIDPARAPMKVHRQRKLHDRTVVPEGAQVNPGAVTRWVRTWDDRGKESNVRVNEFKDFDYVPVLGADGREIRTDLGLLMQGTQQSYAERMLACSTPESLNPAMLVEQAQNLVESYSSTYGGDKFNLNVEAFRSESEVTAGFDDD